MPVLGFDQEMDVVRLDREVEDAEVRARRGGQRPVEGGEDAPGAQSVDAGDRAKGDVDGMRSDMRFPGAVWNARASAGGTLPAGAEADGDGGEF